MVQMTREGLVGGGADHGSVDPRLVALDAGFELLPCCNEGGPELWKTTVAVVAWGAVGTRLEEVRRVWLALARGLLLRGGCEAPERAFALASELEALAAPLPTKES